MPATNLSEAELRRRRIRQIIIAAAAAIMAALFAVFGMQDAVISPRF